MFPAMDKVATVVSRAMATHTDPSGPVAEASRSAVRAITYFGLNENSGRTLLVTSAAPFDGRTTLATNLAIAMAQEGLRVVIVDANCQSPKLKQIFPGGNTGLFDALSGAVPVAQSLVPTAVENLDFLGCGAIPADPVAALNGETLVDVFGELADHYDRVVIDSPAVNRGVEARILAASCAATVLVMSPRRTNRRAIDQAYQALIGVGANVLGAIINDQEPTGSVRIVGNGHADNRKRLTARELATMARASGAEI
jgi:capsular exopolysaccharide synthesis family protein